MKTKITLAILSLAAWTTFAQDSNPTPAQSPPTGDKPADNAAPNPADTPANPASPAPVSPAGAGSIAPTNSVGSVTNAPSSTTNAAPDTAATAPTTPAYPSTYATSPEATVIASTNAFGSTNAAVAGINSTNAVASTNATAGSTNATAAASPAEAAGAADDVVPLIVIEDVPLTDAIRNLARQSNLNFQFDPRLTAVGPDGKPTNQPNVSIRFENVTAAEALTAVLDNYNLALIRDQKSKIARVTVKDPKAEDPLVSRVIQLRYADPTNVVTLVKGSLSPRSTVVADSRTSQLIVNTTEKELDGVIGLVTKLDTATKQVLIEARLVETSVNPTTIKGVDWSGTLEHQSFNFGNVLKANPALSVNPVNDGFPKIAADTARGFNPMTAFLDADGVSAFLSFINKDTHSQVIATPRAVTLDNQTALLSVTKAVPIFQITPGTANTPGGSTIQYTNLGTILSVTPRIAADKNISMRVVPEVSNLDGQDSQSFQGQQNTANIYAIRRIETHVMIPSGNTLLMGGMLNDTSTKGYVKVPILGDVPGLGWAFRHESSDRTKINLLILITPTIVEDGDFQQNDSGRQFLGTRVAERPEPKASAFDSALPHDWSKPSN